MINFIIYTNEDETLITTPAGEKAFLAAWYVDAGRNLDEYDRTESDDAGIRIRVRGMIVD